MMWALMFRVAVAWVALSVAMLAVYVVWRWALRGSDADTQFARATRINQVRRDMPVRRVDPSPRPRDAA